MLPPSDRGASEGDCGQRPGSPHGTRHQLPGGESLLRQGQGKPYNYGILILYLFMTMTCPVIVSIFQTSLNFFSLLNVM